MRPILPYIDELGPGTGTRYKMSDDGLRLRSMSDAEYVSLAPGSQMHVHNIPAVHFEARVDVTGGLGLRVVSPAALPAGGTNDYADATGSFARLAADVLGSTITGFAGGVDGRILIVVNIGPGILTITHQDVLSAAANRVLVSDGASFAMGVNDMAQLIYDATSERWRV